MDKKHWVKRLFCGHIMKDISSVKLYRQRVHVGGITLRRYDYYAFTSECIKCGHTRIEKRRNIVDETKN